MTDIQNEGCASAAPPNDEQIEVACAAYAKATGYYVEFHRGLSSLPRIAMRTPAATPPKPTAWRVWWVSLNTARTELFEDHAKATVKAGEVGGCVIPLYASPVSRPEPVEPAATPPSPVAWRYQRKEGWGDLWRTTSIPVNFETPNDWTVEPLYTAILRPFDKPAASPPMEFPYQQTFDAICAAVNADKEPPFAIHVSVKKFQDAFNGHRDARTFDSTTDGWIAAQYTDGPNSDGYYSAGIDIPRIRHGKPDMHGHAIEFHSKDKATAEARRDLVLTALAVSRPNR